MAENINSIWLTTIDNPYNPFKEWDSWYEFDCRKGYLTCQLIARLTKSSFELSEVDEMETINDSIKNIISLNINPLYKIITDR